MSGNSSRGLPEVEAFFHEATNTVTYLVVDPASSRCSIIDPVLDYDASSGRTAHDFADRVIARVRERELSVDWLLETHVHADHLTAAIHVQKALGGTIGIGANITIVQEKFRDFYNLGGKLTTDGSQFDHLFADGEAFKVGGIEANVIYTPGHTPACISYWIGDAVFTGDALFMPDFGTARCDFPGGDARTLYRSTRRILALPPETRVFVGHDYGCEGRGIAWESTVAEERASNKHVGDAVDEEDFVRMRTERDATLSMPKLILPSIQVNVRAGHLPEPEENGCRYLKIPLNAL